MALLGMNVDFGKVASGAILALMFGICIAISLAPEAPYDKEAMEALVPANIAWLLCSTALVLIMTPGVAFFYAGMVRHKNVVATMVQALVNMAIIPLLWAMVGFSLAFGADTGAPGFIGNPATYGLWKNVGAAPDPDLDGTVPTALYATYQMTFAIVTPSLIVGSMAERVNFTALCVFISLWHLVVYCPLAHMAWHPAGALKRYGILDFAGGTVVHMGCGWSALAAAWFLGPADRGPTSESSEPANVPFVVLGTTLLWFGWLGFNGGSAGAANALAVQAVINTNIAAASAMLSWLLLDNLRGLKFRATGLCFGAVAGMVVVTPAAGYIDIGAAGIMGIIATLVSTATQLLLKRYHNKVIDDTLDVFAVHGMGGVVGSILTPVFASSLINPNIQSGALHGNWRLVGITLLSIVVLIPWLLLSTLLCLFLTNCFFTLRVTSEQERVGLDVAQHGERAVMMELSAITGRTHKAGAAPPAPSPVPTTPGRPGGHGRPGILPGMPMAGGSGRAQEPSNRGIPGLAPAPMASGIVASAQQRDSPRAAATAGGSTTPRSGVYRAGSPSSTTRVLGREGSPTPSGAAGAEDKSVRGGSSTHTRSTRESKA